MPLHLTWPDIAIRLLCAFAAGLFIGLNRSEHGRPAGMRTSILVCLAACIAMIQVNLLLPLSGRASNSFVMNDLMRLPLGILSGIGFIGGGAILRRDNFVIGVTTAATLWFLTVLGLCFGGGQIALGLVGTVVALLILPGLKIVEDRLKEDCQGRLVIVTDASGPGEEEIRTLLQRAAFGISSCALATAQPGSDRELTYELRWQSDAKNTRIPEAVYGLAAHRGVVRIDWRPQLR